MAGSPTRRSCAIIRTSSRWWPDSRTRDPLADRRGNAAIGTFPLLAGQLAPPQFQLVGVAAQRMRLGQQADDVALVARFDDGERLGLGGVERRDRFLHG